MNKNKYPHGVGFKVADVTSREVAKGMAPRATAPLTAELDKIKPDAPLRLSIAAKLAYPDGSMTVSGLRREAAKGRLAIERVAGKDYTTLAAIEDMRVRCRVPQKQPDCGSNQKNATATENLSGARRGSSVTDHISSARAALEMTAKGLIGRSPHTSRPDTKSLASGTVIRIKSSS